jgi:3-methylcrotonyl-CoA carboxylase alpha subunit
MLSALGEVAVEGVATNAVFLGRLLDHSAFRAGDIYTGFAAEHAGELLRA